ncbi:MAG: hypothetical protein HY794_06850 [Desulfarculus sp.]|nr:hypothetical protein [Desulfarculus sp.]
MARPKARRVAAASGWLRYTATALALSRAQSAKVTGWPCLARARARQALASTTRAAARASRGSCPAWRSAS